MQHEAAALGHSEAAAAEINTLEQHVCFQVEKQHSVLMQSHKCAAEVRHLYPCWVSLLRAKGITHACWYWQERTSRLSTMSNSIARVKVPPSGAR